MRGADLRASRPGSNGEPEEFRGESSSRLRREAATSRGTDLRASRTGSNGEPEEFAAEDGGSRPQRRRRSESIESERSRRGVGAVRNVRPPRHPHGMDILRVDCNRCAVRGAGCGDCVISVLLGVPEDAPGGVSLVDEERAALEALAGSGLVPPLRLVHSTEPAPDLWEGDSEPGFDVRFAE